MSILRKILLTCLGAASVGLVMFLAQLPLEPVSPHIAAALQEGTPMTPEPSPTQEPTATAIAPEPSPTGQLTPMPTAPEPGIPEEPTPPTPSPRPVLKITKEVAADLVADLDGDGIPDPGDTVGYVITYENAGGAAATGVTIVDDYKQSLIQSITNISGEGKNDGDTITWDFGTVETGVQDTVTYEATLKDKDSFPPGSTNIENSASIDSDQTALVSVTNVLGVKRPDLTVLKSWELAKDLVRPDEVDPGDTIKITITYENIGEVEATGVTIVDNYHQDRLSITSISGEGQDDGNSITWDLGTVEPELKHSVTYEAVIKSTIPPGSTRIDNTASIASHETKAVTAEVSIPVEVPTPTPMPTPTPATEGPKAGVFGQMGSWGLVLAVVVIVLLGLSAMAGLMVTAFFLHPEDGDGNLCLQMIFEGITVILIICAVMVLALGLGFREEAAASILSAVAGYVFGRSRSVIAGQQRATPPAPAQPPPAQPSPQDPGPEASTIHAADDLERAVGSS